MALGRLLCYQALTMTQLVLAQWFSRVAMNFMRAPQRWWRYVPMISAKGFLKAFLPMSRPAKAGYLMLDLDFPQGARGWMQRAGCSFTQKGLHCGEVEARGVCGFDLSRLKQKGFPYADSVCFRARSSMKRQ